MQKTNGACARVPSPGNTPDLSAINETPPSVAKQSLAMLTRTHTHTYATLEISRVAHTEILQRITGIGPDYVSEYIQDHEEHGKVIVFGPVGLVAHKADKGADAEQIPLPNGCTLYASRNAVGGTTYLSDEIGGGVAVWDTALVCQSTLLAAMVHDATANFRRAHEARAEEKPKTPLVPVVDAEEFFES